MASRGTERGVRGRAGKRLSSETCLSEADQQMANVHFVTINLATVPHPHPIIAFVLLLPVSCCSLPTSMRKESSAESLARVFKWVDILLVNIDRHVRVDCVLNVIVVTAHWIDLRPTDRTRMDSWHDRRTQRPRTTTLSLKQCNQGCTLQQQRTTHHAKEKNRAVGNYLPAFERTRIGDDVTYNLEFKLPSISEHLHLPIDSKALDICSSKEAPAKASTHHDAAAHSKIHQAPLKPKKSKVSWIEDDIKLVQMWNEGRS